MSSQGRQHAYAASAGSSKLPGFPGTRMYMRRSCTRREDFSLNMREILGEYRPRIRRKLEAEALSRTSYYNANGVLRRFQTVKYAGKLQARGLLVPRDIRAGGAG
ncbi:hypothetical protein F442_07610 [Phytophthora nicotianae P10297]|uniref:Uncharacterized protein n=1 Tax=Phytophthora nicotianae P10297 TaxID=1317064 RepID=W2ZFF9_PHYNI|nr:hypothetical protein F442_07610 [Phytophthora nicotianae P10297]